MGRGKTMTKKEWDNFKEDTLTGQLKLLRQEFIKMKMIILKSIFRWF